MGTGASSGLTAAIGAADKDELEQAVGAMPLDCKTKLTAALTASNNGCSNMTDLQVNRSEQENLSGCFRWTPEGMYYVSTRAQLLSVLDMCHSRGFSLRVVASAWSCNRFLDPNSENGQKGVNISLCGELATTLSFEKVGNGGIVEAGAGTEREPIYKLLEAEGMELLAAGECFTTTHSQQLGGLIANSVHDTMQHAFTPEAVLSLEAAIFNDAGKAEIRSFSAEDGDAFHVFFGGMGMTGVIVSAKLLTVPRRYYHRMPYRHGTVWEADYQIMQPPPAAPEGEAPYGSQYKSSLSDAVKDLVAKHRSDRRDVVAFLWLFQEGVVEPAASRYYAYSEGFDPKTMVAVEQDEFNDACAILAKQYASTSKDEVENLSKFAIQVQDAVNQMKWHHANLKNTGEIGFPHWAYYASDVAHTTGPYYVYLWDKAVEFYVQVADVEPFCDILEKAVQSHLIIPGTGIESKAGSALPVFADVRYCFKTETGFMTGMYQHDSVAIDVGCTKFMFTNEQFHSLVTEVLGKCKDTGIKMHLHTGKFFVHDRELVHSMYDSALRTRFRNVIQSHDKGHVFSTPWMRDLFAGE